MTILTIAGIALVLVALGLVKMWRTERRQFDERSDVTKMVRAASQRRRDANTAVRFMREK